MALYAVTVRLKKNPSHDPKNKKTGPCPVPPHLICDDVTGEHHTLLTEGISAEFIRSLYSNEYHVTRVEEVILP